MQVQITDLGVAALTAGGGAPVVMSRCDFGSGVAYIPLPTDTALHGATLFTVAPSTPVAVNANVVRYSAYLDYSVGPFNFGEFGLFMANGELFALGSSDTLIAKLQQTSALTGNSVRLDVYLSMVGTNYDMWLDLADSNSDFRMATVDSVDQLLPSSSAIPNAYIVQSAEVSQTSFLAYTDRVGLWNFDAYAFSTTANQSFTVTSATNTSVTIPIADYNSTMIPAFLGDRVVQFTSSALYSICRNVVSIATTPTAATINFQTPLAIVPPAGSTFFLYKRDPLSTTNVEVAPATTTSLGVVKIGSGLDVVLSPDPDAGLISVDRDTVDGGLVFSVNGEQGDVELEASDIPGSVLTVNGQSPDGAGNVTVTTPPPTLPIATLTTAGVVKASATVTVAADGTMGLGFTPVTSVNGQGGAITITGLIKPTALTNAQDLNTVTTSGLYYAPSDALAQSLVNGPGPSADRASGTLEAIPQTAAGSGGDVVQRWTQANKSFQRKLTGASWSGWVDNSATALPAATTSTLGAVIIGTGLTVDLAGVARTQIQSVNGHNGIIGPDGNPETPNIILSPQDVGAIPEYLIGAQGGVAGPLNEDPVDPPPDLQVSDYIYGRMPMDQLPLGAYVYVANWNAATNSATYTDAVTGFVHTLTLLANGEMTDSWSDGVDTFTITVPADGKILRVTTAGSTSLDGNSVWVVGDQVVAVGAQWRRWPASIAPDITPTINTASLTTGALVNGVFYNYTGPTVSLAMTTGMTVQEFTIYTTTNPVTFTGAAVATASGGLIIPGGAVASVKKLPTGNYLIFGDTAT